uniref:60S ribosomal protein L4 C-terminal domain-containing protein n=1 Tax=Ditylenchus dipsaci TaxID=166011 RepID=A0A915DAF0_9BILA
MTNSDFARLIRSEEITKVVRPCRKNTKKHKVHRNPLKKPALMVKLNPYAKVLRRAAVIASQKIEKAGKKKAATTNLAAKKTTKSLLLELLICR